MVSSGELAPNCLWPIATNTYHILHICFQKWICKLKITVNLQIMCIKLYNHIVLIMCINIQIMCIQIMLSKSIKFPPSSITFHLQHGIHRIQGAFVAVTLRNMGDVPRAATSNSYPRFRSHTSRPCSKYGWFLYQKFVCIHRWRCIDIISIYVQNVYMYDCIMLRKRLCSESSERQKQQNNCRTWLYMTWSRLVENP